VYQLITDSQEGKTENSGLLNHRGTENTEGLAANWTSWYSLNHLWAIWILIVKMLKHPFLTLLLTDLLADVGG